MKPYPHCRLTADDIISFIDTIQTDRDELKKEVKQLIKGKEDISEIHQIIKSTIDKHSMKFFSLFNNSRLRKDLNLLSIGLKNVLESEQEAKCKFEEFKNQQQYLKDDKEIDSIIDDVLKKTENALKYETLKSIAIKFNTALEAAHEKSKSIPFCQLMELRISQFLRLGCGILKLNDDAIDDITSSVKLLNLNRRFTKASFGFDMLREKFLTELFEQVVDLLTGADSYTPDKRGEIVIGNMVENILKNEKELVVEDNNWLFKKIIILCHLPKYTCNEDLTKLIDPLRISLKQSPEMSHYS